MIVLGLRENDIECRTKVLPDGTRKILVAREDEGRAREILREIESSDPIE
jgi:hypothetical protein